MNTAYNRKSTEHSLSWLHLIWALESNRAWIPKTLAPTLTSRLLKTCRLNRIYVDVMGTYETHIHLLLRKPNYLPVTVLRGLISYVCKEFLMERGIPIEAFQDWIQRVDSQDIGRLRRLILRQEQMHSLRSFDKERELLGLEKPSGECLMLGHVFGPGAPSHPL